METLMVGGETWSGWLHIYPTSTVTSFTLEVRQRESKPVLELHKFYSPLEVEQYCDEMDIEDFKDMSLEEGY